MFAYRLLALEKNNSYWIYYIQTADRYVMLPLMYKYVYIFIFLQPFLKTMAYCLKYIE